MPIVIPPDGLPFLEWRTFNRRDLVVKDWHFDDGWSFLQKYLLSKPYLDEENTISEEGVVLTLIAVTLGLLNSYIAQYALPEWAYWSNSKLNIQSWEFILDICKSFVEDTSPVAMGSAQYVAHSPSILHVFNFVP